MDIEETLFDITGLPVAYIDFNDMDKTIYLWNGIPVAYMVNMELLYGFNGTHLGWYQNGIIWNLKGERTGYNKNTCPVYKKYEPYKSYKQYKPFKMYRQYAHFKPFFGMQKSQETLVQFLSRGR